MMKKFAAGMLVLSLALSLAACTPPAPPAATEDTRALSEIMTEILADVPDLPESYESEVTADNFEYTFFIENIEGAQGLSSDALMSVVPHSVSLLRVPEGVDPAATAAAIEQNLDLNKWICVSAEQAIVKHKGHLILLVMSSAATAQAIADNFS